MLHAAGAELAQQSPGGGQEGAHVGAGLALQHGGGQLELAHGHDIGLLLHLHQALGQEQLQLRGQDRGTLRYCHPCGGIAAELPLTWLRPWLPRHTHLHELVDELAPGLGVFQERQGIGAAGNPLGHWETSRG